MGRGQSGSARPLPADDSVAASSDEALVEEFPMTGSRGESERPFPPAYEQTISPGVAGMSAESAGADALDEVKRLRACLSDLVSILALPAIWSGDDDPDIARTLVDALVGMLRLDFACLRLTPPEGGAPVEIVRVEVPRGSTVSPRTAESAVARALAGALPVAPARMASPIGAGELSVVPFRLGIQDELGVLVAGSGRADFPTSSETLVLRVAANQAAIAMREARIVGERMRAQDALEQRVAERTRQLIVVTSELAEGQRLSHTGSWTWNVATEELSGSAEHFRIFGFDPAPLVASCPIAMDRIHADDRPLADRTFAEAFAQRTHFKQDFRVVLPDGLIRYVQVLGHPVFDDAGALAQYVGTSMDVTERTRAEQRLRRSEELLAQGQRISHTGSWAFTVATGELLWSQEHFRIFGFDPALGQPSYETALNGIHPEDRLRVRQAFERAVREHSASELDLRALHPDGSIRHVHSVGQPVFDASGALVEFVGTIMDVTERRETEQTLQATLAELAHVARRATAGELTASIAHELNQPLAAVVTNGGACLRWLAHDPPDLAEATKAVRHIIRDANRASNVIGNIRALLQKSGRERIPLDITEAVSEVLVLVEPEVTRHRILVQERLARGLPAVLGVRGELQQVLLNLIVNSIEAMADTPQGVRSLIVSSEHHELDGTTGVLVAVEDTGAGLTQESLDRIFEAFHTTKPHGLGMGLSIARSIVESHGGRLWATRNPGLGATFQLVLPASTPAAS
jgi:PAS domain S-box-containing protein